MKLAFAGMITALVLIAGLAGLSMSSSEYTVPLAPIDPEDQSTGVGKIRVESGPFSNQVQMKVNVMGLEVPEGYVFEGWLVDVETGYKLSLGSFVTQQGAGTLMFQQNMVNFDLYDTLVITQEPAWDADPNPFMGVLAGSV